jgi:DNA repair protein RadC
MPAPSPFPDPSVQGHRQRLRARLFEAGAEALQDYELLEMLLFSALPRRDVKPLAKKLLAQFGTLWALLNAKPKQLMACDLSEGAAALLLTTGAIILRAQKGALIGRPLLNNWQRILDYCRAAMAHKSKEQCRVLFFDRKNNLIAEDAHDEGTIDHAPVYPREVVARALELGAGALVLVHNHPTGDITPSKDDIAMTRAVADACRTMGLTLHDHLIVGKTEVGSYNKLGLL